MRAFSFVLQYPVQVVSGLVVRLAPTIVSAMFCCVLAASVVFAEPSSKPRQKGAKAITSTPQKAKPSKAAIQQENSAVSSHKIWLSVDVVEQTATPTGPDNSREKYRSDGEINVVDSASGKNVYARSGDMIALQPRRTYFVMLSTVPQNNGVPLAVSGLRTQVLRTGVASEGDIMYERKFMLIPSKGGSMASNAKQKPQATPQYPPSPLPTSPRSFESDDTPASTNKRGFDSRGFDTDDAELNARSPFAQPLYYVIQYCSLAEEEEALNIRNALVQGGVRDARVELYNAPTGQRFYRVRSGSYPTLPQARAVAGNSVWASKRWTALKIKPIVVPSSL